MSDYEELRNIIFTMLNFTNMYCLVLDENMNVKFVNTSLALDMGFNSYEDIIGKCWLDFIIDEEKEMIKIIHAAIAYDTDNWEKKYREIQSRVITKDGKNLHAYWFNSHINTDYNWCFSFGIKKIEPDQKEHMRDFYSQIIQKDRIMINSMRDAMGLRDKIVDTCKPKFIKNGFDTISVG